jgi:hypothetical protein
MTRNQLLNRHAIFDIPDPTMKKHINTTDFTAPAYQTRICRFTDNQVAHSDMQNFGVAPGDISKGTINRAPKIGEVLTTHLNNSDHKHT